MSLTRQPIGFSRGRTAVEAVLRGGRTIRGRIFLAFLMLSAITASLGGYAAFGIMTTGALVDKTYDRSLMAINYARAAATDLAMLQAAVARARLAGDSSERRTLEARIEALTQSFEEDLEIAADRAQSERATREAAAAKDAVTHWLAARREFGPDQQTVDVWQALDAHAAVAEQHIDLLINFTAGDGFSYRQTARADVARDVGFSIFATSLAIVLSGIVALLLLRQIVRPVADASTVASRIAAGELTVRVPEGGDDEFGALLRAMAVMRDNIAAMMQEEVAQRHSAQSLLADAVQGSIEGIVVVDAGGRIVLANARAAALLGIDQAEPGHRPLSEARGSAVADALLAMPGNATLTAETHAADGRWLRISRSPTREGGFVAVCSDVSLLKEQEDQLKRSNAQLDAALSNMLQGLCLYDSEGGLLVYNRRFCDMFGVDAGALRPGMTIRDVARLVEASSDNSRAIDLLIEQEALLQRGSSASLCCPIRTDCIVALKQQPTAEGGWIATYEDVTQRYEAEARIITMARKDALTGLANRMVFGERLEEAAARLAEGDGAGFATLCLDLDRFKEVNDTLGHPIGDGLLRSVAERLQSCLRETDLVARLGGDEFAIVQAGTHARRDASALAKRLIAAFQQPFLLDGHTVTVGLSIGISLAPEHGTSPEKLLKSADLALYRAKATGRGCWSFFDEGMDVELRKRRALESDLKKAVGNGEFELVFQPIVKLDRERIASCEALLRWRHPERGYVSPADFIPLAEETGTIGEIGEWVLHKACSEAATWPAGIGVAVNVSAAQFRNAAVVRAVMDALAASGLPAHRLELEITESVLLNDSVTTLATLHTLKRLGVRVAMDDFGTGFSSLSYLQSFPFDKIKIDQSFVRNLAATGNARLIVRSVVGLGRSLGMTTTAEGIETEAQLDQLRLEGCDEGQGYLFSRPVPSASIRELVTALGRNAA
ncbi:MULTISPECIES: EAL domain-containing protein [Methylorubrum]|uniref:EAL domain-containing protein n=1 Tax=Methylorubrum TaxID=2282523 RepID=UPI0020A1639F|nr:MULTISPECIES: EAL domain-containing protein [Methylorubrum]MCP1548661.1 diguanylate cyclase (GGDEF)-like protein [Methylorubrum zatmanii]MCP1554725.1 diguanylate cyclase (GGDEF)-like protein [Methylorubrum extorquens]MCP1578964.1 diguanylate cyclase (GGDEF)-like protein [Methylorubrum extorquens]